MKIITNDIIEYRRKNNLKHSNEYYHRNKDRLKKERIDRYIKDIPRLALRKEKKEIIQTSENPKILLPIIEKQIEVTYTYTDLFRKVECLNFLYELQKRILNEK
jgi:hypothetical protein